MSQYSKMVYSYIHGSLRGYGRVTVPELVEELYQEVFVSLLKDDFKKLKSFGWKNNCSFSSWLKVVISRLVLDYLKKHSNREGKQNSLDDSIESEEGDKQTLLNKLEDKAPSAVEVIYAEEKIDLVRKQVQKLPASDQLLFRLIYDDMPVEDIAKHMNKSVEAIYMQKTRVLDKLSQELQKKKVSY